MPRFVLFVDDGGVMNDNALRGPQWQKLLGDFFTPILGGTPEAWAEANRIVAQPLWDDYARTMRGRVDADYMTYYREYELAWLGGMCELVGAPMPSEEETLDLVHRANDYVTRRVRSAFTGAIEAIRNLNSRGYQLHTASGEHSTELNGYLEGMNVRGCFWHLYGPDLVNTLKEGPEYYIRIFADAGVSQNEALVIDDSPIAISWAAKAGARTVLVSPAAYNEYNSDLTIASIAELPRAVEDLEELY